jgi:hypothetical protein
MMVIWHIREIRDVPTFDDRDIRGRRILSLGQFILRYAGALLVYRY